MGVNYDSYLIARERLMDKITIPDYYRDYIDETINLEQYNRDCCPLHDEDSPSFFYFEDTRTFHCFGCGKTGGVVELHFHLQERMKGQFKKSRSVIELANMYNVKIPNIFDEVTLDDKSTFKNKNTKIKFKKKHELVVPVKKLESDVEGLVLESKSKMNKEDWIRFTSEVDEILFVNADVKNRLEELKEKYF